MGSILKESDHKRRLVSEITPQLAGYARRIEDRSAVGALDMIIKPPRHSMLPVSLKAGDRRSCLSRRCVSSRKVKRIIAAGVSALLIGWKRRQDVRFSSEGCKGSDKARLLRRQRAQSYALTLIGYLEQGKMKVDVEIATRCVEMEVCQWLRTGSLHPSHE